MAQFMDCVKGYEDHQKLQADITDSLNYALGQYMMTAYHEPKKYPKMPYSKKQAEKAKNRTSSDEQRLSSVKARYGRTINGNNH